MEDRFLDAAFITSYISQGAYFIKPQTNSQYSELRALFKEVGIDAYTLGLRSVAENYDNQSVYIKRIVAVAGDTVQLTDCRVYVNGVYVYPYTCDIDSQIEYHLEEGQYFVLGDNGEASIDSRDFGVISENQLLGKAIAF